MSTSILAPRYMTAVMPYQSADAQSRELVLAHRATIAQRENESAMVATLVRQQARVFDEMKGRHLNILV